MSASASALPESFGSEGARAGQLSGKARGIAIEQESHDLYVSDTANHRIEKFKEEGEFLLAFGWGVADEETQAPQSCTSTCFEGIEGSGAGQFKGNEGIAVDNSLSFSHGDLYVLEAANERVQKFGPEGKFIAMFGGEVNSSTKGDICTAAEIAFCKAGVKGSGAGEFSGLVGRAIAVDSAGGVWVGDENRVQHFSPALVLEAEYSLPGVGPIENLTVDSAGELYLHGANQAGVHEYHVKGTELEEELAKKPRDPAGFGAALALAIGVGNALFVNDLAGSGAAERHHILSYAPAGEQTSSFDAVAPPEIEAKNGNRGIADSLNLSGAPLYILNKGRVRITAPPSPGPFILLGSETSSELQPTSAKLEALANPEGPSATKCHFEYGETAGYGTSTPEEELKGEESDFEDQPLSAALTGLLPGRSYHFRLACENAAAEVSRGPDETFTTLPAVSIDSTSASEVNDTSARLNAELNPHGQPSEYHFEYDTKPYATGEAEHGIKVPSPDGNLGSGTSDTLVSNLIVELLPATTYHYRVVAHNPLNEPGEVIDGPDHSFKTRGPSATLADGRIWELVSPPNKHGSPLEALPEEGGLIQAAADGGAFTYVALGPVNGEPQGNRGPIANTQLLATHGEGGWSTRDITTPHEEISIAKPLFLSEYLQFSEDLKTSIVEPFGAAPLSPQTSERTPYRREAGGEFAPLVTAANVEPAGTKFGGENAGGGQWGGGVEFRTATPDLSHAVLESPQVLAPGFKAGFKAAEPNGLPNLYELAGGRLSLVSVLPDGEAAAEAGLSAGVGGNNLNMRGAIASDGSRVIFEAGSKPEEHLYLRETSAGQEQTLQLDTRQPGAPGGNSAATFQAANSDESKVFFTDSAQLTADATAKPSSPDLYMCEVRVSGEGRLSCALSDLSVDLNPGEAASVVGEVSAIDASGSKVYFAANGVLTHEANARGEVAAPRNCEAEEGSCNLYEYDTEAHEVRLVAVLASKDSPGNWARGKEVDPALVNLTARSSPDGRYFTFMSERSLTGYDNRDVHSGQADEEVFLYDSESGGLSCVSCDPSGARPNGVFDKAAFPGLLVDRPEDWPNHWLAGSLPGWTQQNNRLALRQPRYLTDSGRLFFNSSDALVPEDSNHLEDVYQFEPPGVGDCTTSAKTYSPSSGGCVNLVSSGTSKEESAFLDATESGDEAFFLTAAQLVKADVDSAFDVYSAHACSAELPCTPTPPEASTACEGDACATPSQPPASPTPGSLTYSGPENPPPQGPSPPPVKAKPTRAQLLASALKTCRKKHAKKRRLACEKQARKRYGAKKASAKKHARKAAARKSETHSRR